MQKAIKRWFPLFVVPTVLAFIISFIAPFIMGIYLSFTKFKTVTKAQWVGFSNYTKAFEDSAFIYDDRYAQEYKSHFVAAKGECKKIDFQEWKTRTIWTRITESFVRVLSPLF